MGPVANAGQRADFRRGRLASTGPIAAVPRANQEKPRYHAFDALRGMTMFLVVGLHAALGYIERDIPRVLWCIRDAPTLPVFDWFCWWSMSVSNPLYFTIAGFFAVELYNSRGLRGFLVNRTRRVLIPFAVGVPTILPACLCAWSYGWLVSGRCTWPQLIRLRFRDPQIQATRLSSGHLWFLEYLLFMLLAYALVRWLIDRWKPGWLPWQALVDFVARSSWHPLLLVLPTTALLWLSRQRLGIDATMDRHNGFLPDPVRWLHYTTFFVVGTSLHRLRHDLCRLTRIGPWCLVLSVPVFAGRAWLLGQDWTTPLQGAWAVSLAASGALFGWLAVFGFIGLSLRLFHRSRPSLRYLADSSYWIYLVHMPVLGLIQVNLSRVPGHALWKAPLVLAATLALGFASYHTLVRHTSIGTALHGRRERAASPGIG